MPVTAFEPKRLSDLLKFTEEDALDKGYILDFVTVNESAATDYEIGMLVGQVTANSKYKISDPNATDGSEDIAFVVLENISVPATTDTQVKVLVRGKATVADDALVLGDHTLADATAALNAMNPPVLVDEQV
ncbi:MAG: putative head decoration protein D [Prokaryotic dsDNA virus sp.]|nr:MAG: putative head decoration protein D [Prokaryotic dsDNA virus sp.]|tara:strand:+ start:501 stop:896 length:396 start_codon:yes stop_codon:yes gene_type:complete